MKQHLPEADDADAARQRLKYLPDDGGVPTHVDNRPGCLTLAYLHWWDKGKRIPADLAARLIEKGYRDGRDTSSTVGANTAGLKSLPYRLNVMPPA